MDVFPNLEFTTRVLNNQSNPDVPLLKEYAWDFGNDDFLLDNGRFIIVEGIEALKIRNYLSLKIYKDRFFIYKSKVGTRLKDLIGKDINYVNLHIREMLEEALLDNIYVTSIEDIETEYNNSKLTITFTIRNIYMDYVETIEI